MKTFKTIILCVLLLLPFSFAKAESYNNVTVFDDYTGEKQYFHHVYVTNYEINDGFTTVTFIDRLNRIYIATAKTIIIETVYYDTYLCRYVVHRNLHHYIPHHHHGHMPPPPPSHRNHGGVAHHPHNGVNTGGAGHHQPHGNVRPGGAPHHHNGQSGGYRPSTPRQHHGGHSYGNHGAGHPSRSGGTGHGSTMSHGSPRNGHR